jgi:hypothetical protein
MLTVQLSHPHGCGCCRESPFPRHHLEHLARKVATVHSTSRLGRSKCRGAPDPPNGGEAPACTVRPGGGLAVEPRRTMSATSTFPKTGDGTCRPQRLYASNHGCHDAPHLARDGRGRVPREGIISSAVTRADSRRRAAGWPSWPASRRWN